MALKTPEDRLKWATTSLVVIMVWGCVGVALTVASLLMKPNPDFFASYISFLGLVLNLAFIGLGYMAYSGIQKKRDSARILALWLSVPMLVSFPIGTVLGLFIWIQLSKAEVKALFIQAKPAPAEAPQNPIVPPASPQ